MAKKIPECPPIPKTRHQARETREFQIQLVTPMFGGGVVAGEPDPTFPIRGTSIRGQLQFWWRATVGAQYETLAELHTAQSEIWGSTERVSRVQVLVENVQASVPVPCAKYPPRDDGKLQLKWEASFSGQQNTLPYALFPFQGQLSKDRKRIEEQPASYIATANFQLILQCPSELWAKVEPAVWAWVNFGGIGARTRRGCGSLFCAELAPASVAESDLITWFRQGGGTSEPQLREWPTLPSRLIYRPQPVQPIDAWNHVIRLLKHFRQGVELGRNPGQHNNRPGRSRWPEPETIRQVTQMRAPGHPRLAHIPEDAFPRAEFGLPIVFHFQGQGEPQDTVLYPASDADGGKRERMNSPLILKPLMLANGESIPLMMRLVTPELTNVELYQGANLLPLPLPMAIRGARLATYANSPMSGTGSETAIDAFLALAKQPDNGFKEVGR